MSAVNVLAIVPAALVWLALVLLIAAVCGSGRRDDVTNGGAGDAAPATAPRAPRRLQ